MNYSPQTPATRPAIGHEPIPIPLPFAAFLLKRVRGSSSWRKNSHRVMIALG
jgi:hypothetical protein